MNLFRNGILQIFEKAEEELETETHRGKGQVKTEAEIKMNVATSQGTPMIVRKFQNVKERHRTNYPSESPEGSNPVDT